MSVKRNNYFSETAGNPSQQQQETLYNFKGPIPLASRSGQQHDFKVKKNKKHKRTKTLMYSSANVRPRHSMVQSPALQMDGFELNIMPQQLSFGRPPATPTLQQSQSTKELIKIPRRSTYQHNGMSVGNEIMLAEAYQPKSRK